MIPLAPQEALAVGVFGALGLGLLRRPSAGAARILGLAAPLAALVLLKDVRRAAAPPLILLDLKSLGWQVVIYAAALPLAFSGAGGDVETALFLGTTLGMGLLAAAGNLLMLFVGLEFMSLPAYLLVARAGGARDRSRKLEAAVKYFFAGALAGALFLLGLALYYAETRSLGPTTAPLGFQGQAGVALMAAAALFKIGAVPLHWWLPDVYEAAAPEVAGYLSTSMKAAAVLFLMRVVQVGPNPAFVKVLPGLGAATALIGSLLALRQQRLQRLLAYSSLAHAGLLVLGVGAWARLGRDTAAASALLLYLGVYALMSNGAFAFLGATGFKTRADLKGYASRRPGLAAAFTALLFALGGVPPTGGFMAKLLILWQAVRASLYWPAALAAVAALLSLGYYLALARDMYFEEPAGGEPAPEAWAPRFTVLLCALGALALGAAPFLLRELTGVLW